FFEIPALQNFPNNDVTVFNRWGNVVYKTDGYANNWDGRNWKSNDNVPDGTYFYILKVYEPEELVFQGYLMIHR
ncbi:MAG: gliding motility-associated C-terminal domain-containing protein, partial [Bacteroidota bacterium]